jgi:hypothetical protein
MKWIPQKIQRLWVTSSPFFSSHYYFSLFFFNLSSVTRPIAMTSVLQDSKRRWKSEVMASFHSVKWAGTPVKSSQKAFRVYSNQVIELSLDIQIWYNTNIKRIND